MLVASGFSLRCEALGARFAARVTKPVSAFGNVGWLFLRCREPFTDTGFVAVALAFTVIQIWAC